MNYDFRMLLLSGLGWQPCIFWLFNTILELVARLQLSLSNMKIINAQNPALIAWYTRLVFSFRRECHFVFFPFFPLFLFNESWSKTSYLQVFGLYFMQSYIGLFYHAVLYRNFMTLQQLLIQRLIVSQVRGYSFSRLMWSRYSCWT